MTQRPDGFKVELITEHFTFTAYGESEIEANEAMGRALTEHGRLYGLDKDWTDFYNDGYTTRPIVFGAVYRDNERII